MYVFFRDEEADDAAGQGPMKNNEQMGLGTNPFLDIPVPTNAIEYKKGYVMRKCCYEANAKRSEYLLYFIMVESVYLPILLFYVTEVNGKQCLVLCVFKCSIIESSYHFLLCCFNLFCKSFFSDQ